MKRSVRRIIIVSLLVAFLATGATPNSAAQAPDEYREDTLQFAPLLIQFVNQIRVKYYRTVSQGELLTAAMSGLYEATNQTMPEWVRTGLTSTSDAELLLTLSKARTELGRQDAIAGRRAFIACATAITRALDPHSCLTGNREFGALSDEQHFNAGVAFANAPLFTAFDPQELRGRPMPRPRGNRHLEPSGLPESLLVRTVIPGSPAQRAGLRPGDRIVMVDAQPSSQLGMTKYREVFFPVEGEFPVTSHRIQIVRPGRADNTFANITPMHYAAEGVFGVRRDREGQWDCMLDATDRIGYVRIGPIDRTAGDDFHAAIAALKRRDARGVIIDLRWCTGGYIDNVMSIVHALTPETATEPHINDRTGQGPVEFATGPRNALSNAKLVLLIGCETVGGGELIAACVQDSHHAVVAGDRTAGKGSVQKQLIPNPLETYFPELKFKVTTGILERPSKANLQRFPNSGPNDEWGVRPDAGRWLPVSRELNQQLKEWWTLQSLRPADDRSQLPTDDLEADPQLKAAVKMLKASIEPALDRPPLAN